METRSASRARFCIPQVSSESDARRILSTESMDWLGKFGEAIWANVLAASGYHYVPLAELSMGGAPMMQSNTNKIVLPDFDAMKDGKSAYLEAKAKSTSVFYRISRQERHGIDLRNFKQYQKAAAVAGKRCAIAIVECMREEEAYRPRWSGSLLIESLIELGEPVRGESNQDHMIYWRRKQFRDVNSFTAVELFALANGTLRENASYELDRVFNGAFKQAELF